MMLVIIVLALFRVTNCGFINCQGAYTTLSDEVDCTDQPVCETTCDFVFANKVGNCAGKKLNFLIPNAEEYKEVCIYKNYGEDDDVNFSKEVIEQETGIKENVEKTDLFQEYTYRLKKSKNVEIL